MLPLPPLGLEGAVLPGRGGDARRRRLARRDDVPRADPRPPDLPGASTAGRREAERARRLLRWTLLAARPALPRRARARVPRRGALARLRRRGVAARGDDEASAPRSSRRARSRSSGSRGCCRRRASGSASGSRRRRSCCSCPAMLVARALRTPGAPASLVVDARPRSSRGWRSCSRTGSLAALALARARASRRRSRCPFARGAASDSRLVLARGVVFGILLWHVAADRGRRRRAVPPRPRAQARRLRLAAACARSTSSATAASTPATRSRSGTAFLALVGAARGGRPERRSSCTRRRARAGRLPRDLRGGRRRSSARGRWGSRSRPRQVALFALAPGHGGSFRDARAARERGAAPARPRRARARVPRGRATPSAPAFASVAAAGARRSRSSTRPTRVFLLDPARRLARRAAAARPDATCGRPAARWPRVAPCRRSRSRLWLLPLAHETRLADPTQATPSEPPRLAQYAGAGGRLAAPLPARARRCSTGAGRVAIAALALVPLAAPRAAPALGGVRARRVASPCSRCC